MLNALGGLERSMGEGAFRAIFKTITADNGSEFLDVEAMKPFWRCGPSAATGDGAACSREKTPAKLTCAHLTLDAEEEEFDSAKIFLVCRDEKRGLKKDDQNV